MLAIKCKSVENISVLRLSEAGFFPRLWIYRWLLFIPGKWQSSTSSLSPCSPPQFLPSTLILFLGRPPPPSFFLKLDIDIEKSCWQKLVGLKEVFLCHIRWHVGSLFSNHWASREVPKSFDIEMSVIWSSSKLHAKRT